MTCPLWASISSGVKRGYVAGALWRLNHKITAKDVTYSPCPVIRVQSSLETRSLSMPQKPLIFLGPPEKGQPFFLHALRVDQGLVRRISWSFSKPEVMLTALQPPLCCLTPWGRSWLWSGSPSIPHAFSVLYSSGHRAPAASGDFPLSGCRPVWSKGEFDPISPLNSVMGSVLKSWEVIQARLPGDRTITPSLPWLHHDPLPGSTGNHYFSLNRNWTNLITFKILNTVPLKLIYISRSNIPQMSETMLPRLQVLENDPSNW